ncbi:MAG: 16S rRNA (guanine(966)-N(2))-methyltransferase RsmD [Candidatus Kryptoniota bacterium]
MRVTGGVYRSRILRSIRSDRLRPATDRLRETMFNILNSMVIIKGASVLDLYAGTGSVGIEALSRGASHAVFVESNRRIAEVIKSNIRDLNLETVAKVENVRVEKYLLNVEDNFDIIFVDPPYSLNKMTAEVISQIFVRRLLKKGGIICIEHSKGYMPASEFLVRQKTFGTTILSFLKEQI